MRLIVFILLCASILGLIYVVFIRKSEVDKRLLKIREMSESPYPKEKPLQKMVKKKASFSFIKIPEKVKGSIISSGVNLRSEEFVMLWISVTFIPAMLFFIFFSNTLVAIMIALVGAFAPPVYVNMKNKKRLVSFGNQLGDALMLMSNGLRAGFSFEQVLETVAREMPDPVSTEFARVTRELKMGMTLEKSLTALTERMQSTDMRLLTSAVLIQRQVGGNLAEILDTICVTIQDRIKIKNNIKTMSAQGRISGLIVGALPIFLFVMISTINGEYMEMFYTITLGRIMLIIAICMEAAGFFIIRKMINLET